MKNVQNLVNSTLASLSETTLRIMAIPAGQFLPALTYASKVDPAAEFKGVELTKQSTGFFTAGKSYENLKSVKEGIANNERGEVEELKGKTWENFPYTMTSDKSGKRLIRLYPVAGRKSSTRYFVNGVEVEKTIFAGYLPPAKARDLLEGKKTPFILMDKTESEIIGMA